MMEEKIGSFVVDKGRLRPNGKDDAMAERHKLNDGKTAAGKPADKEVKKDAGKQGADTRQG